jgi:hypothetical protein
MELQLDLPLVFISNVLMVSIDVHSSQPGDEDMMPMDVKLKYYRDDLLKPSKVSPLHIVFNLKGVFARQGKSFKPCTLTPTKWYRNLSVDLYVIPRLDLQEFLQRCFQQFIMNIWTKCKPYNILLFLSDMKEYIDFNFDALQIFCCELC